MWETALLAERLSPGHLSFLFKMNAVCAWKFENKQPFKSKSNLDHYLKTRSAKVYYFTSQYEFTERGHKCDRKS